MCINMRRSGETRLRRRTTCRSGISSLDYVLILGVVFPLAVFIMKVGPRIMRLAYEMVCLLISWPFM